MPNTVQASNANGSANLDMAITSDGKFLYSLNAGTGTIGLFAISKDGRLMNPGLVGGLRSNSGLNGIAAF